MVEYQRTNSRYAELDSVDWAILDLLQLDASAPNKEIAAKVGVAPSTCLDRIRRLKDAGVIASVRAEVDPAVVGRVVQAFLALQIRPHSRETAGDFVRRILAMPETLTLYNVSGVEDYVVHVAVEDSSALQSLIVDRVLAIPQVAHCNTQLIFGTPWHSPLRPERVAAPRRSRGSPRS